MDNVPMPTYREIPPSPRLVRYIECYWSREDREGTRGHSVLPDGCADILFSSRGGEPEGLAIVGLMTAPQVLDVAPGRYLFGVRFRPGMASAFFPDAPRLNDRTEPFENIVGASARPVLEQLAECSDPAGMARAMDGFLFPLEPAGARERVLQRLATNGLTLDAVVRETGISARSLRRLCMERAGVSPKYLVRILRFRNAAERIAARSAGPSRPNWAEVAAACGYYDQAHFIRDFRQFAGCTPGRYLQYAADRSPVVSRHEPDKT